MKKRSFSKESPDSIVDVFEAIKLALIRRGFIRQKQRSRGSSQTSGIPNRLSGVTVKSHDILFKANTVFPLSLFPDTVTLDREKLTFATRFFFAVSKTTSVPVRDILSVELDTGPFFGSVHTSSRYFITNPYSVHFLWRKDAIRLQRLLQGYIIAEEQKIDCTNIDKDRLMVLLNDLGQGDTG